MNATRMVSQFGFMSALTILSGGAVFAANESPTPPADAKPASAAPASGTAPLSAGTFEELAKEAVPAKDLTALIEPLYARCDDGDELHRRQCEGARTYLLDYLHSHTFIADADIQPETSPYDATAKQVDMEVPGCVACVAPPRIAGEPRYLVTRPPQRIVNGRAQVAPVASHEIAIADRVHADRFVERVVPRLRVQHVFRIGAPFGDTASVASPASASAPAKSPAPGTGAAAKGVLLSSLGHRVYDRCTGEVTAAIPPSTSKVAVKPDRSCPKQGSEELSQAELKEAARLAALPERLTPRQIDQVLAPVQTRIHECYVEFGEPSGTAKVQLTIGHGGKLTQINLPAPFDKADIGLCMRAQLKAATFPKFRGGAMSIDYVYQVN